MEDCDLERSRLLSGAGKNIRAGWAFGTSRLNVGCVCFDLAEVCFEASS